MKPARATERRELRTPHTYQDVASGISLKDMGPSPSPDSTSIGRWLRSLAVADHEAFCPRAAGTGSRRRWARRQQGPTHDANDREDCLRQEFAYPIPSWSPPYW